MYEREVALFGIYLLDNAHVTHRAGRFRTAEEDQIARFQICDTFHRCALSVLHARGAAQGDILLTIDIAGEAGAIESCGTGVSVAVAGTDVLHSGADHLRAVHTLVLHAVARFVCAMLQLTRSRNQHGQSDCESGDYLLESHDD